MLRRLFSASTNGLNKDIIHEYQPMPRWGHSAAAINGKLYIWGGCMDNLPKVHSSAEKTSILSQVEIFDPRTLLWEKRSTTGTPPLGVYWNAYTNNDKCLYTFGGYCGHGNCYHNSVHQLDVSSFQWREVMAVNPGDSPMKKWQCGMVSFTLNKEGGGEGDEFLCVFGGWGLLSASHKNTKHEFIADRGNVGCVWSNELHFFNLNKGTWECPTTTGSRPPPCQGFTFTQVDADRVVLFGGFQPSSRRRVNDVFILHLQTKHWIRLYNKLDPLIPWPIGRDDHSACIKNGTSPLLLTIGGVNNQFNTLGDLWIMDVDSGRWKQVSAPQATVGRRGHSTVVFSMGPKHFLLIIYGGISEWLVDKSHREQPIVTETAVIELCESEGGDWKVLCEQPNDKPSSTALSKHSNGTLKHNHHNTTPSTPHSNGSIPTTTTTNNNNSNHSPKGAEKRQRTNTMTLDRRAGTAKQLEESKKEIKTLQGQLIDAMNIVKRLKRQGEESEGKNKDLEKEITKLREELSRVQSQLSTSEEKTQIAERQIEIQKCEIENLKKKSSSPELVSPLNSSPSASPSFLSSDLHDLWLVQHSEVQLTQAELTRDHWSSIYVGAMRGLHLSAKCYKEGTLTEDNTRVYIKSIRSALKIRHPNIIQLIGATLGSNPIILTELMPTTLKMTLRQGPLPKRQILSISSEITGALHYIHQMGVLHQDLSTLTILLEPVGNSTWKAKLSECASSNFTSHLKLSSAGNQYFTFFAAPEAKAPELYSPKTDVYSLGVVLLEMCQPTEGMVSNLMTDIRTRLQCIGWPIMASLVKACTSPAPSERPSTMEVLKKLNGTISPVSSTSSSNTANSESLV